MGKKHEKKSRELEDTLGHGKQKPLLPKFLANTMIVVCSVHHGDYSSHSGVGQILQSEFNCSIIGSGFSITPSCVSHLTSALAGGEYVPYVPDISHWILIFKDD